jgi:preprotein translocase subunit SecG
MYIFFAVLLVLVGIFMIFAVLVQNSKGGGLAANFASGNQTFGVRQTADYIEKFTWYLVVALFIFCFSATASIPGNVVKENRSAVQDRVQGQTPGSFPVTGLPTEQESEGETTPPETE